MWENNVITTVRFREDDTAYKEYSVIPDGGFSQPPQPTKYDQVQIWRQLLNVDQLEQPTALSSRLSTYLVITICKQQAINKHEKLTGMFVGGEIIVLDSLLIKLEQHLFNSEPLAITIVAIFLAILVVTTIALGRQPRAKANLSFEVSCHKRLRAECIITLTN